MFNVLFIVFVQNSIEPPPINPGDRCPVKELKVGLLICFVGAFADDIFKAQG
jgi:hypothetical protein